VDSGGAFEKLEEHGESHSGEVIPRLQSGDRHPPTNKNNGSALWTCWKTAGVCIDLKNCSYVIGCMPIVTGCFAARLSGLNAGLLGTIFWLAILVGLYLCGDLSGLTTATSLPTMGNPNACFTLSYAPPDDNSKALEEMQRQCYAFNVGTLFLSGMLLTTCMVTMRTRIRNRRRQDNFGTCLLDFFCATVCSPCVQCQILHDEDVEYAEYGRQAMPAPAGTA